MARFRMKTLENFAAVHASGSNPFARERHLVSRTIYKERRSAALAEWRSIMA
jgi:putative transposase